MEVRFDPPLDIRASLELFRRSGDDLIDRWDGQRLVRTHAGVPYVAELDGGVGPPKLRVKVAPQHAAHTDALAHAVGMTFFSAPPGYADLLLHDTRLRRLNDSFPGVRQVRQPDLLGALLRCISAQQVNLRWATTTRRRLAEAYGHRLEIDGERVYRLDAARLAEAHVEDIRALQFTTNKAASIVAVAREVANGLRIEHLSDADAIARLSAIRGLGRWSAEWILARHLGRPVVVAGDLGVRKAVGLLYLDTPRPSDDQVRRATAHWDDSTGAAQALVLHALAEGLLR